MVQIAKIDLAPAPMMIWMKLKTFRVSLSIV